MYDAPWRLAIWPDFAVRVFGKYNNFFENIITSRGVVAEGETADPKAPSNLQCASIRQRTRWPKPIVGLALQRNIIKI